MFWIPAAVLWWLGCATPVPPTTTTEIEPASTSRSESVSNSLTNNAPENIARRILKLDAQVRPVTEEMARTLDEVMSEAGAAIARLPRKQDGAWDRAYAVAALRFIDAALINHGFLYPATGNVGLLADGLKPFQMDGPQRRLFEAQAHNRRRAAMIEQRFPGPFYVLDCDTASFVYLGVGEQLNLPLRLVTIPSFNRQPGHAFVRWREGPHYLDWETMDGMATTDDYYVTVWRITPSEIKARSALADLSIGQVIGCEHYLLAIQYEQKGDFEQALRELSTALDLCPENLDARAEFAWDTATGPGVRERDNAGAIADALYALRLVDDPDVHDTLAAAYASAGGFDLAVKEEKLALVNGARSSNAKTGYEGRLRLYQQHTPYRQSEPSASRRQ